MKNFLELIENGIAELKLNWRKYISGRRKYNAL